ncbi:MAG: hypothetical protein WKF81_14185, partial [Thermomicrobiales bacterium]
IYVKSTYGGDSVHLGSTTPCQPVNIITGALIASVADATLDQLVYSNDAEVNNGGLVLNVTDSLGTATGWSVSISVANFTYTGIASNQPPIPAANLILTGTDTLTTITVIIAAPGSGSGSYAQILFIELNIPASSSAGTYTSVITVTTSTAP